MRKCRLPHGMKFKPDGVHELDPCKYEVVERHENVTVEILRCRNCGHQEITWYRNNIDE